MHTGPSTIGLDTIYASRGKIPAGFLRGAGVPDSFITYMASVARQAIDYYSCFISYSSRDQEFAKKLHDDLQENHVRVWFAPENLRIGAKIRQGIDEAIKVYDKLLIVLSEHAVTSTWVEKEVETAFDKERIVKRPVLFPIRLDDAVMNADQAWAADIKRQRNIGDFCCWRDDDAYQKALNRLLRDLKQSEQVTT